MAAYKLLSSAIGVTREQLQEMVAISDKATDRGVSGNFFQRFVAESNRLKVSASDLENALSHAFEATKEKSPIDLSEWQTGKEKITEVEKALRVFNATGTQLQGLVLFRDAQNQDQKFTAILTAVKELDAAGRKLESLQLAELGLGKVLADHIRLGKTSADQMLETLRLTGQAATGIFSDEMISRAKEIDNRLLAAQGTLSREMRPSMDVFAKQLLDIKNYWAEIVEYMAAAFRFGNQIDLAVKRDELSRVNRAIETGDSLIPGVPRVPESVRAALGKTTTIQWDLIERRDRLAAEIEHLEGRRRPRIVVNSGSRGAGAAPTRNTDEAGAASRTRFDGAVDSAEKRIATLSAETAAIDLGTVARERAKLVAELETAAKQANAAAGKDNTAVTAEQAEVIQHLADLYGAAAQAAEAAKGPLASYAREARDLNRQLQDGAVSGLRSLEDGLIAVTMRTAKFSDAVRQMANSVLSDLLRIGMRGAVTGPLAGVVAGITGGAGGGGVAGGLFGGGTGYLHTPGGYSGAFPQPFAKGGVFTNRIVNGPTLFRFADGGGFGLGQMGEAGPEAVMPLRHMRGGRLGIDATGMGQPVNVIVKVENHAPSAQPSVRSVRRGRDGHVEVIMMINQAVRDVIGEDLSRNGEISQKMANRFGLDPTRGM
ncbi:phage tail tape measure C-terminal domain-containing protein [Pseudorhodoplanes sp.]|uniref:phage tail tape measure C-terminal domain-containing protein n=1 Tax=Pseudorhodoplanes sp. TaxID=1934341 RepID=UPI003D0B990A